VARGGEALDLWGRWEETRGSDTGGWEAVDNGGGMGETLSPLSLVSLWDAVRDETWWYRFIFSFPVVLWGVLAVTWCCKLKRNKSIYRFGFQT
jgi:hypothetical protein